MSNNSEKLAIAALAGLLTAGFTASPAMAAPNPYPQGYTPQNYKIVSAEKGATMERGAAMEKTMEKHACKGHNSCKGTGGCKTGDNGCKGKNSCKGKGGCATDGSKPDAE